MPALKARMLGLFILLMPVAAMAACNEKPTPLPVVTEAELDMFVAYLNSNGVASDESCKGKYKKNEGSNDLGDRWCQSNKAYCDRWRITGCANNSYAIFKGDFRNDGHAAYLIAREGGSGHFDSLDTVLRSDGKTLVLVAPQSASQGVLPGDAERSSEAAGGPGHIAYPFLTKACGMTYMHFEESSMTGKSTHYKKHVTYLWKNGDFKKINSAVH